MQPKPPSRPNPILPPPDPVLMGRTDSWSVEDALSRWFLAVAVAMMVIAVLFFAAVVLWILGRAGFVAWIGTALAILVVAVVARLIYPFVGEE